MTYMRPAPHAHYRSNSIEEEMIVDMLLALLELGIVTDKHTLATVMTNMPWIECL